MYRYSGWIDTPMTTNVDFTDPKLVEKYAIGRAARTVTGGD